MTVTKTATKKRKEMHGAYADAKQQPKRQKIEKKTTDVKEPREKRPSKKIANIFDKGEFGPLFEGKHKCLRCEWSYLPTQLHAARGHLKVHKHLDGKKKIAQELKDPEIVDVEKDENEMEKKEKEQKEKEQKEKEQKEKEKKEITYVYPNIDTPEFVSPVTVRDATAYFVTICHLATDMEVQNGLAPQFERKIVTSTGMEEVIKNSIQFFQVTVVVGCKASTFEMASQALREKYSHFVIT